MGNIGKKFWIDWVLCIDLQTCDLGRSGNNKLLTKFK